MKTISRRHFFKAAGATAAVGAVPVSAPAVATLLEAGAGLCLVLTVAAAGILCVVRLCRPRYTLYFSLDENKPTNGGRTYLCLDCTRAEAQQRELNKCEGPFTDLVACQNKASIGNTNYMAFSCGPVASEPPLRASITLERTSTPGNQASWRPAGAPQTMDLNADDPSVTFTVPRQTGSVFFRASATSVA